MITRKLKYYEWSYENEKILLLDKKNKNIFELNMAMADSFVRAYISFKNNCRLEREAKLRKNFLARLQRLKER